MKVAVSVPYHGSMTLKQLEPEHRQSCWRQVEGRRTKAEVSKPGAKVGTRRGDEYWNGDVDAT